MSRGYFYILKDQGNHLAVYMIYELPAIYVINGKNFVIHKKGEENHEKLIESTLYLCGGYLGKSY